MVFRPLIRRFAIGSLVAAFFFVANNASGVASAATDRERCTVLLKLNGAGAVRICATVIDNLVLGKAILSDGAKLKDGMSIAIYEPKHGTVHLELKKQSTISKKLPAGEYVVAFNEGYGIEWRESPLVTVPK